MLIEKGDDAEPVVFRIRRAGVAVQRDAQFADVVRAQEDLGLLLEERALVVMLTSEFRAAASLRKSPNAG